MLFDLDGTLTHSEPGVVGGVLHTLEQLGLPLPDESQQRRYLGPPLHHSFTTFHEMDDETASKAVAIYREYYDSTGAYQNEVYEGIEALLRDLVAAGKRLAVATSKVEYAAITILRHFNLDHYFDVITGADASGELRGTKATHSDVVRAELMGFEAIHIHFVNWKRWVTIQNPFGSCASNAN